MMSWAKPWFLSPSTPLRHLAITRVQHADVAIHGVELPPGSHLQQVVVDAILAPRRHPRRGSAGCGVEVQLLAAGLWYMQIKCMQVFFLSRACTGVSDLI